MLLGSCIFFIILCCLAVPVGVVLTEISCYRNALRDEYPKLTFKAFLSFYNLNSDGWKLRDCVVVRIENVPCAEKHYKLQGCNFASFADYLKYTIWKHKHEKQMKKIEADKKQSANMAWVLREVKQDIAKMEQQSDSEIQQAKDTMMEIGGTK